MESECITLGRRCLVFCNAVFLSLMAWSILQQFPAQFCTSNCTKLVAGVTPPGRSSWSSTSDASASPVYFPSPTAAAGSWFSTVPRNRWHIPASFSRLRQLSHQRQDSCSQPLPSRASTATGSSPGACTTTPFCQVFLHGCLQTCHPIQPLSGRPLDLPVSGSAHPLPL